MRIGVILLCRYNSSRLPGKILMEINGKKVIEYIYERINKVVNKSDIIIATSDNSTDDPISEHCLKMNWTLYRGSLENVSLRFLSAAKKAHFDYAIRINGDNVFIDIPTLSEMIEIAIKNQYDLISNVKNRTFPKGMSVEIIRTEKYNEIYKNYYKTNEDFEHVTSFLYKNDNLIKHYYFYNDFCPEYAGVQMALDDNQDLQRTKNILDKMQKNHLNYNMVDIMKLLYHEQ